MMHPAIFGLARSKGLLKFNAVENSLYIISTMTTIRTVYLPILFIPWKSTIAIKRFGWLRITEDFVPIISRSGTFQHYSKEDGLTDNIVYAIEKDHHGNFWFSSNAGISAYNAQHKNIS